MRTSSHLASVLLLGLAMLFATTAIAADADIVVTEIMQNPSVLSDTVGEWFEIHNTGTTDVDIEGWTIKDDGTDSHVIANGGPLVITAGSYAVLARDAAMLALEGVTAVYQYSSFILGNSADEVVLLNVGLTEIDRLVYDGGTDWPDPTGASMMWLESTSDNNVGANWAEAVTVFGNGDKGTPGAPNGDTPLQPPVVTDVMHRSLLPTPGETVTVTADVTDADGTIASVSLYYQINGGGFSIGAMTLTTGSIYSFDITGGADGDVVEYFVEATDNDAQISFNPPTGAYTYTVAPESVTTIASVHADSLGYAGTVIMVQGQVYIPGDYKADGTSVSAYIQDASGRGLNIYGTTRSTGGALLNDTTAIVKVTGTAVWFGTTVELVNYEVELVSSGNPALSPAVQASTLLASAPTNEGTYIEAGGPITDVYVTTGTNEAYNFTINDGSGPLVVRIDSDVVVGMDTWLVGDQLDAAGAGSTYSAQGQILVGLTSDVVNSGQGPDLTPPTIVSASFTEPNLVTVTFSESLDPTTAQVAGNYSVYETATPGNTVAVNAAVLQFDDAKVVLTIASSLTGTPHTLEVSTVADVALNPIAPASTIGIFDVGPVPQIVINEIMQNPAILYDADGEWFEVYNAGATAVDMNGWTLKDAGLDSLVIDNGGPLVIGAGEYKVFGVNATAMLAEGVTLFFEYSGMQLSNGDDELIIWDTEDRVVDVVAWDDGLTFPDPSGSSMQWTGAGDNADGTTWSDIGPVFGTGDRGTPGAVNDVVTAVPSVLKTVLGANHPNPFNPSTEFRFSLERDAKVNLSVFDMRGRLVRVVVDTRLTAGDHSGSFHWDGRDGAGRNVNSGTYFYRLSTDDGTTQSRKMTLLK
jgi:lamin tail-like protein/flagellar hook capping protein FlgD